MTIAALADRPYSLAPGEDEFEFLPQDAARVGRRTVDPVRRVDEDVDGLRVSALRWGTGPIRAVHLHGVGLNAHSFDPVVLAVGEAALAIDLPGHGHSAWRADVDYSPAATAPVIAAVLDRCVDGPVTVIGHSWGGLIALQLLADRPDLVARLILVDITPEVTEADAASIVALWAGSAAFPDRESVVELAAAGGFGADRASLVRGVRHNTRVRSDGSVVWAHHFGELGGALPTIVSDRAALWAALERATVPVTLVRADQGFLSEDAAAQLSDRAPAVEVVVVSSGHNVQELAPAALADVVRAV